jgi:uncharacterized membrane protein YkoI
MRDKLKGILILGGALVALGAGGAAIAGATGGDSEGPADDAGEAAEQVSDQATADRARDAALEATGGGTVTEIERADEGDSGYEVEVKRPDGSFAEVALDADFNEVSVESDDD